MNTTRALALSLALALLALALLVFSTPTARAAPAILRVTMSGKTTGACGSSWGKPCGLQHALMDLAVSGDELWVASGTYTPATGIVTNTVAFELRPGIALYGGFAMTETLRTQRNFTANVTILSGDLNGNDNGNVRWDEPTRAENAYHVVVVGIGVTNTAVLDGFTVTGGNANDPSYGSYGGRYNNYGGGMYNDGSSPTVANVTFSKNTARNGGAMFDYNSSPALANVTFSNNAAGSGGGMLDQTSTSTLTNVTFSGNWAYYGGGMYNFAGSSPTLSNATFISNSVTNYGSGMFDDSSSPALANVTFISNTAGLQGGGMYNVANSNPTVANVTFSGNSAGSYGGGMHNFDNSNPTLMNVTFSNNTAGKGGGVYDDASSPTLTNVTFANNNATYGSGMNNEANSSPTLTNVTFLGNVAALQGGGMSNQTGSNPMLSNVTFSGNGAGSGGAIYSAGSSPMLTNITFSGNFAESGGAMYGSDSSSTLTNTTFVSNTASISGGGMYNFTSSSSSPTIRNTIFWGNGAPSGSQIFNDTSIPTVSDSVVQGGYGGGSHIITADPLLGALGNWGGSTQTIPLLPGSSAVDAGNNATCAPTDQRGMPRLGTCDVGAFEFQGYPLAKTGGDHQSTRVHTPFASSLQVTLTEPQSGLPVAGATITFTAPSSGPSAAWGASLVQTATTNGSGVATVSPPTANGIAGSYMVTVSASVQSMPVTFALTNLPYYLHLPLVQK